MQLFSEYSIARHTTDDERPAGQLSSADQAASLRDNLAEQLASAQKELSANLIALRSGGNADPSLIAQGDAQLGALLALSRQLSQASPAMLARVQAEIVACVAAATSVAQQAQAAAPNAAAVAAELAAASEASRAAVASFTRDYFEKKIFDPYLSFASAEEEQAYRKREAERQKAIEEALAQNTPQGDLKANTLAIEQLKDAGAHGADKSPQYQETLNGLTSASENLKTAMGAEQADKGRASRAAITDDLPSTPASGPTVAADILAKLRSSGVEASNTEQAGHGLTGREPTSSPYSGRV